MREVHIEVARHARYFMLGQPSASVREIWIVCHGFAQLASRFLRRFESLAHERRLIVAPEALNRFYLDTSPAPHGPDALVGATWMTREDRHSEIVDYVRYLDAVHQRVASAVQAPDTRLLVLGFSQGVATVCRWVSLGKVRPNDIVLWSGHLPADLELSVAREKWRPARLRIVWGTRDPGSHGPAIEHDRERLAAAGLTAEWLRFEGGHELSSENLDALVDSGRTLH